MDPSCQVRCTMPIRTRTKRKILAWQQALARIKAANLTAVTRAPKSLPWVPRLGLRTMYSVPSTIIMPRWHLDLPHGKAPRALQGITATKRKDALAVGQTNWEGFIVGGYCRGGGGRLPDSAGSGSGLVSPGPCTLAHRVEKHERRKSTSRQCWDCHSQRKYKRAIYCITCTRNSHVHAPLCSPP